MEDRIRKLVARLREGESIIAVDQLRVTTPLGEFECPSLLNLQEKGFSLEFRFAQGKLPNVITEWYEKEKPNKRSVSRDEFWSAKGTMPDYGPFTAKDIIPPFSHGERLGYWSSSLRFGEIDLRDHPLTPEEKAEREAWLSSVMERFGVKTLESSAVKKADSSILLSGWLCGIKTPFLNEGTTHTVENPFLGKTTESKLDTFLAESSIGTIAWFQEGNDLQVHLRRKSAESSQGAIESDEKLVEAVLRSVGVAHGVNALPFYFEHQRDSILVAASLRPRFRAPSPSLNPFWEGLVVREPCCRKFVSIAAEFFSNSDLSDGVLRQLLWLFHDSDQSKIPHPIRILSVCSLLEGLVNYLLGLKLAAPSEFGNVKKQAVDWAMSQTSASAIAEQPFWGRLVGYLKGWGFVRPEEKWQALCAKLKLPWEGEFRSYYETWKRMRNPLAHGSHDGEMSSNDCRDMMLGLSRLGGAFITFLAAHMGYRGPIQISPLEKQGLLDSRLKALAAKQKRQL